MDVIYKCQCMPEEATVWCRDRRESENVVEWVQGPCIYALAADHAARSPKCRAKELQYMKIPFEDDKPVGTPVSKD